MIVRWLLLACAATPLAAQRWEPQASGVTAELRGVSAVNRKVVWGSWVPMDTVGYNALSTAPDGSVWAVGPRGRIASLAPIRAPLPLRKDP